MSPKQKGNECFLGENQSLKTPLAVQDVIQSNTISSMFFGLVCTLTNKIEAKGKMHTYRVFIKKLNKSRWSYLVATSTLFMLILKKYLTLFQANKLDEILQK